jgi:YjbE family integral membrane protein
MDMLLTPEFWIGLVKIVWINIILSGDNAVVIALAARTLPPNQQRLAVLWGSGAAVVLRVVLSVVAAKLLELPYLQIVGGLLLLWIGVQLLGEEDDEGEGEVKHHGSLGAAIRTILIADLVMSLDNVIAVAAAAQGSLTLLVLGLAISIPLVIFGATILMKMMGRYPIIITIGAALIGYVAGEMLVTDPVVLKWFETNAHWMIDFDVVTVMGHTLKLSVAGFIGAAFVVAVGKWLAARHSKAEGASA